VSEKPFPLEADQEEEEEEESPFVVDTVAEPSQGVECKMSQAPEISASTGKNGTSVILPPYALCPRVIEKSVCRGKAVLFLLCEPNVSWKKRKKKNI
jgi:hypothetical protein